MINNQELVKKYWKVKSYKEIGNMIGKSPNAVRCLGRRMGLPPIRDIASVRNLTPEKEFERTLQKKQEKTGESFRKNQIDIATQQVLELQKKIELYEQTSEIQTFKITKGTQCVNGATAFAVASDWHYWETVNPSHVNDLNEFNKEIAEKRANKFFVNAEKLLAIFSKHSNIENLVVPLLGDFISGNIHEELLESNQGLVIDELMAVQKVLTSGLEYLLKETRVNILVPCHYGNHGRITEKTHISTAAGNSLEYLMYHNIASYFKDEKRIKFNIARGNLSYLDINGFTVRFHHGDAIKYGGGMGGIFIPAFKAISQWDKAKRADLDVFGHFHQCKDGGKFVTNGSLVGYNDFALKIKADYEKPKQLFFLVDHDRREKTVTTPIFLD